MDKEFEDKIRQIVNEEINKFFSGIEKEQLYEYAEERKDFIKEIKHLLPQIIQNWCLINHSRITGLNIKTTDHWKGELYGHLSNIMANSLKNNDNYKSRLNAIKQAFQETEYDVNDRRIRSVLFSKFAKEGIPFKLTDRFEPYVNNWKENVAIIEDVLALKDDNRLEEYINEL